MTKLEFWNRYSYEMDNFSYHKCQLCEQEIKCNYIFFADRKTLGLIYICEKCFLGELKDDKKRN